ncbi:MAG: YgiW/YdeI family stress tolerance OB fold protein, partial [Deefgea sp.]
MKLMLAGSLVLGLMFSNAYAQFTGPGTRGATSTVEQLQSARANTYVTVTGNIVDHQRKNYYTFRDETGEIRVEIEPSLWRKRNVGPTDKVRLMGELERNAAGSQYIWVKTLDIV